MNQFLQGKKSYFVAAASIAYGVIGFLLGHLDANQATQFVFGGSGLAALRAGMKK